MNKRFFFIVLLSGLAGLVCAIAISSHIPGIQEHLSITGIIVLTIIAISIGSIMYSSINKIATIWVSRFHDNRKIIIRVVFGLICTISLYFFILLSADMYPLLPGFSSRQELEIINAGSNGPTAVGTNITVIEIKIGGKKTPFNTFEKVGKWVDGPSNGYKTVLSNNGNGSLKYVFNSPPYKQVLLHFLCHDMGGIVRVRLGHRIVEYDLYSNVNDEKRIELTTTNETLLLLLIAIDILAILSVTIISLPWLISPEFMQNVRRYISDILVVLCLFTISLIVAVAYVSLVTNKNLEYYKPTMGSGNPIDLFHIMYPYGIFFGIVVCLAYIIFRFGMNQIIGTLCTLMFMTSSNHLNFLPGSPYYDYIKVPFMLSALFLSVYIVTAQFQNKRLWLVSLLFGILIGIAQRYRGGVQIYLLYYLFILVFFLPLPIIKQIKSKFFAIALVITGYSLVISPAFGKMPTYTSEANSIVVPIMGGFMRPMNWQLGVTTPSYDCGYLFLDEFIASQNCIKDYLSGTKTYSCESSLNRLVEIIRIFPADILIRIYASILRILELPFMYLEPPFGITTQFYLLVYSARSYVLSFFAGSGLVLLIISLLFLSCRNMRYAFFFLFTVLFLGGYPALQFFGKHYFYLEIITWWIFGFIISHVFGPPFILIMHYKNNNKEFSFVQNAKKMLLLSMNAYRRMIIFGIIGISVILLPLFGLRSYQSWQVSDLYSQLLNAKVTEMNISHREKDEYNMIVAIPNHKTPTDSEPIIADYFKAEFGGSQCGFSTLWPVLRYSFGSSARGDYSRTLRINLPDNPKKVTYVYFSQVSRYGYNQFQGIELPANQLNCIRKIGRIDNTAKLPIIFNAIIPQDRRNIGPLYQQIVSLETNQLHTVPASRPEKFTEELSNRSIVDIVPNQIVFRDQIVNLNTNQWIVDGYATTPSVTPPDDFYYKQKIDFSHSLLYKNSIADISVAQVTTDLVRTQSFWMPRGSYFLAEGKLYSGGVTLGLVKDGHTAGFVHVIAPGRFKIVIEIQENGTYWVGLANNINNYTTREQRLVVNRIGWVMMDDRMVNPSVMIEKKHPVVE